MSKEENGNGQAVTLFGKPGQVVKTNSQRFLQGASGIASSMRSDHPFVNFGHKDGIWTFGKDAEEFDVDGLYAGDSDSIMTGFIAWKDQKPHVHMVKIGEPLPELEKLPNVGAPYEVGYSMVIKAVSGAQKGQMFIYRTNTYGGRDFFEQIIRDIGQATVDSGLAEVDDLAVPVFELSDSNWHSKEWGKIFKPEYVIHHWLSYSTGAELDLDTEKQQIIPPTPTPAPAAADNTAGRRRKQPV